MFVLFSENLAEHIIIHRMQRSLMLKKVINAVRTLLYGIQTRMKSVLQAKLGEINFRIILSPSSLSPKQYILLKTHTECYVPIPSSPNSLLSQLLWFRRHYDNKKDPVTCRSEIRKIFLAVSATVLCNFLCLSINH